MKLRNRLLLVGLGVVIFLIVTPVLVLFARGFKFDWKNKQILKTGTMVVKTEPENAQVFLNDEPSKDTTPSTIRFLLPDDYEIRIEKEGYLSWTKRLAVRSQLVTWANQNRDFISLFLQSPQLVETKKVANELQLTETLKSLNKNQFGSQDDEDWIIEQGELKRSNPQTKITETIAMGIPEAKESKIIRANGSIFLILDKSLYILNDSLEKIYDNVDYAYWDQGLDKLLYANDFEIFLYSTIENSSELILRSTSKLSKPLANGVTGYVFFQNEDKIKAIELDSRDHRNVYTLTDALDGFLVSKNGKKLYVFNQSEIKIFEIR